MTPSRPDGALLAGVCVRIARTLGWNAWALRAVFVVFLLIKTLWAVAAYALLALAFHFFDGPAGRRKPSEGLGSPELAARKRRIADLERRFRDLENGSS